MKFPVSHRFAGARALIPAVLLLGFFRPGWASEAAHLSHARLMEYLDKQGRVRRVRTPEDWNLRRALIIQGMEKVMGKLPDRSGLPPLKVQKKDRIGGDTYTRFTISFSADTGEPIPAYLYLPRPRPPHVRFPAVLALHPTSPLGKAFPRA